MNESIYRFTFYGIVDVFPKPTTFLISSLFLRDVFYRLAANEDEELVFATGSRLEDMVAVERMLPLTMKRANACYAEPDIVSVFRTLNALEEKGHTLTAMFHRQPGRSAASTLPSGTDRITQDRYEQNGHVFAMGIFNDTGHIRFVQQNRRYEVAITGSDIEEIETNLYRLRDAFGDRTGGGSEIGEHLGPAGPRPRL